MKKAWYAVGAGIVIILLLTVSLWHYSFRDPLTGIFKKLKVGMSEREAVDILKNNCSHCEEDSDGLNHSFMWNWDTFQNPIERDLVAGLSLSQENASYIALEFENGKLKDAQHAHNAYLYLVLPSGYRQQSNRGYTVIKKECLATDCGKESQNQGGVFLAEDYDTIKNWFKKILP